MIFGPDVRTEQEQIVFKVCRRHLDNKNYDHNTICKFSFSVSLTYNCFFVLAQRHGFHKQTKIFVTNSKPIIQTSSIWLPCKSCRKSKAGSKGSLQSKQIRTGMPRPTVKCSSDMKIVTSMRSSRFSDARSD